MPELPEVETVVRDLKAGGLVGRRVVRARVLWKRSIAAPAPRRFMKEVQGLEIQDLSRRGKFIVARLSKGFTLLVHLRMSGRLHIAGPAPETRRRTHERVVFSLNDGRELRFSDTRKFGRIWLVRDPSAVLEKLGPEPFALSATGFAALISARSRFLKPLLLDQTLLAGVGNIYSDEALWEARLHPKRKSDSLSAREAATLLRAIKRVLRRGIRNLGTTLGAGKTHFVLPRGGSGRNQEQLSAYGHTGEPCPRCGTKIRRIIVGQRSTHLCPACQPEPTPGSRPDAGRSYTP
jgi:formamidopyrimidine-DNA glycosylase